MNTEYTEALCPHCLHRTWVRTGFNDPCGYCGGNIILWRTTESVSDLVLQAS